jgi:hypothetical protein
MTNWNLGDLWDTDADANHKDPARTAATFPVIEGVVRA